MMRFERSRGGPVKVLVVKPGSLGDVVHALPILPALRGIGARVSWLLDDRYDDMLGENDLVERVIPFRRRSMGAREIARLTGELRRERFEIAIDLQGLARSAGLAAASGARRRIGLSRTREGARLLYNDIVTTPRRTHAVERNLAVARHLAGDEVTATFPLALTIPVIGAAEAVAREAGWPERPLVVLNPFASWPSKRWEATRFVEVTRMIRSATEAAFVVIGGPGEGAEARELAAATEAVSAAGRLSIRQTAGLFSLAQVMITGDSGPMHLAAAVSCRCVALFGPTDPALTGPYGEGHAVIRADADCAPCRKRRCDQRCIDRIQPDRVAREALRSL